MDAAVSVRDPCQRHLLVLEGLISWIDEVCISLGAAQARVCAG